MTIRHFSIQNYYEDDDYKRPVMTEGSVDVRDQEPDESDFDYESYLRDVVFPLTGTGRDPDVGAYYIAESFNAPGQRAIRLEWDR